ncbi:hypothetical protein Nepgr_017654 [Nepenthes gracilis]|uniref:Pectinesterase inhibitor domain-containing protein n=1 Tax=Nepenthes gracilis TaxID=150966 RepID=A0AAD3SPR6_NEPGR|nr:hypothetical protein Nepgr_017654 [Nepenthes gracilis]
MASNPSFLVPLAFLFLVSATSARANDDLIKRHVETPEYYNRCVSTLKSDPLSTKADVKGLASIMVRSGLTKANATRSYLKAQLYHKGVDEDLKDNLRYCSTEFLSAITNLRVALQKLSREKYEFALYDVLLASYAPEDCEVGFEKSPELRCPPELRRRGQEFEQICHIAQEIISPLIPHDL